jgi:hypothetical protein
MTELCKKCGAPLVARAALRRRPAVCPVCAIAIKACVKIRAGFLRRRAAARGNWCHTARGDQVLAECRHYAEHCGECYTENPDQTPSCPREMGEPTRSLYGGSGMRYAIDLVIRRRPIGELS